MAPQSVNDESRHSDKMQPKKVLGERAWGFVKEKTTPNGMSECGSLRYVSVCVSGFARVQTNNHFVNNWVKRCSLQSIYHNEYFIHTEPASGSHNRIISCRFSGIESKQLIRFTFIQDGLLFNHDRVFLANFSLCFELCGDLCLPTDRFATYSAHHILIRQSWLHSIDTCQSTIRILSCTTFHLSAMASSSA